MPINTKVSVKGFQNLTKMLSELRKPIDRQTADEVGRQSVDEMKDMISKGISPLNSGGRFPGYKNPSKYPKGKKPNTPVNLYLSGDFQNSLTHKVKTSEFGFDTEIFYEGRDEDAKESGHRDGANGQPKRPTIPQGSESFAQRVIRVFSSIYKARINKIIGKG